MNEKPKPAKTDKTFGEIMAEGLGLSLFWVAIAVGMMCGSIALGVMVRLFRMAAGI